MTARSTPAQYPRGAARRTFFGPATGAAASTSSGERRLRGTVGIDRETAEEVISPCYRLTDFAPGGVELAHTRPAEPPMTRITSPAAKRITPATAEATIQDPNPAAAAATNSRLKRSAISFPLAALVTASEAQPDANVHNPASPSPPRPVAASTFQRRRAVTSA